MNPVKGVLDEEIAHRLAVRPIEVEGVSPGGAVLLRDVPGSVNAGVVAVGSKVVVDNVEKDREVQPMSGIDEAAQIVRRPVTACRGEQTDAVITPAALSGEVAQRHQLDGADAETFEVRQ